ncbi:MAG: hypothetical protein JO316_14440 [Abitibacteriaceae bacterium]|nr:hypothetical protein [Abditibacteriaceae bacterium]
MSESSPSAISADAPQPPTTPLDVLYGAGLGAVLLAIPAAFIGVANAGPPVSIETGVSLGSVGLVLGGLSGAMAVALLGRNAIRGAIYGAWRGAKISFVAAFIPLFLLGMVWSPAMAYVIAGCSGMIGALIGAPVGALYGAIALRAYAPPHKSPTPQRARAYSWLLGLAVLLWIGLAWNFYRK